MPNEPTPEFVERTTFTLVIKGVNVRIVCRSRWPKLLGKKGLTLWSTIYLAQSPFDVTTGLLAHEFCHVLQWQKGTWPFIRSYLKGLIQHGYGLSHPLERNAHDYAVAYQRDFAHAVALMHALPSTETAA